VSAVLETLGLTKYFGAVTAAADLTVRVEEDTLVGLIGGNGAGKTTFLNLVTGYLRPTAGEIRFLGEDITGLPPRQITRRGICRSFQIPQIYDSLSARENLLVGLGIVALGRRAFAGTRFGSDTHQMSACVSRTITRRSPSRRRRRASWARRTSPPTPGAPASSPPGHRGRVST